MAIKLYKVLQSAYELITSAKINRLAASGWNAAAAVAWGYLGAPASGARWFGDAGLVTPNGATLSVLIAPGLGIQLIASGDLFVADWRPILIDASTAVAISANASGNPRIDLVCVRALEVDEDPQVVNVKDPVSLAIGPKTLNQRANYAFQYVVVAGTPAASPAAPAVPAGYVALASVRVESGAGSIASDGVTDLRTASELVAGEARVGTLRTDDLRGDAGDAPAARDSSGDLGPLLATNTARVWASLKWDAGGTNWTVVASEGVASVTRNLAGDYSLILSAQVLSTFDAAVVTGKNLFNTAAMPDQIHAQVESDGGGGKLIRLFYYDASGGALGDPSSSNDRVFVAVFDPSEV